MKCKDSNIYVGTSAGNMYRLTTKPLKEKYGLLCHKKTITKVIPLEGGRIASSSHDNFVKVWEPVENSFKCRKVLRGHTNYVADIAYCGNDILVSGGQDLSLRLWNVKTKKNEKTVERAHAKVIEGLCCLKDSIVSCSGDLTIKIWDKNTLAEKATLKGHKTNITRVIGYLNGTKIISGSADPSIKIWDLETGRCQETFSNKEDPILSLGMINGHILGAGSVDNKMKLYDLRHGKELRRIEMDEFEMMITGMIRSIISLDDDRYFAAGSTDWNLRIYDLRGKDEPIKSLNLKDGVETICTN